MAGKISEYDDVIDTRDVLAVISDLEIEIEIYGPGDQASEIAEWQALIDEADQYSGDSPEDGISLIRYSYLEEYLREQFEDCLDKEDIARLQKWPYCHIDWRDATEEAKSDYTEIEFREITYYVR